MAVDLKNFRYEELSAYLESIGEKSYRARQIMQWIYQKKVKDLSEISNISNDLKTKLKASCEISTLKIVTCLASRDGSQKFLFELSDGKTVETVYMPTEDRATLCISTQVGCRMGCTFCLTAKQGLVRQLSPSEMVNQVMEVGSRVDRRMTNIVLMGMGEPLDNYESVLTALEILQSKWGLNFSQRRITLSTVGLVPAMERLGKVSSVNLAISLNAATDEKRSQIMPLNRKYRIKDIIEAATRYPLKSGRRITFEYVMLAGLNDTDEDARQFAKLLGELRCKVNLIPFNDHHQGPYRRPSEERIAAFQKILVDRHITAPVRYSRGEDILAACGQLASRGMRIEKSSPSVN